MKKWLWLDMDGTFADLYGVEDWLTDLVNLRIRPYAEAQPLYDMVEFIEVLENLKTKGWNIGIISWLSKNPNKAYGRKVTKAKKEWLKKYGMMKLLSEVLIVPYGQNKSDTCKNYGYGILADDEKPNRDSWENGKTIDANKNLIVELLKMCGERD